MAQISVNNLTFYYDGSYDNIFEDVSFQIDTDWRLGFIARNGRGKTTFLNLLQGKYEYKGTITSPVEFDYFPFLISDMKKDTLSVVEEICPDYEFWKICRELTLLHVDADVLYRPFETLSNGERTKVMLALLFSGENRFLLIDEPTNHLDMETREIVSDYLNKKKGFLLVSHDRTFLDRCVDHVLSINKTNIEVQQGNFSTWWENKKRQDAYETAENERLKKDIKRLTQAARQAGQWADTVEASKIGRKSDNQEKSIDLRAYIGEKSRRMQMRRKNLERRQNQAIEDKSSLLKNIEKTENLKLYPLKHYKDVLVDLQDVTLAYALNKDISELPGRCSYQCEHLEKQVVSGFCMKIKNGDTIVLSGRNGCGKSSILKAILETAGAERAVNEMPGKKADRRETVGQEAAKKTVDAGKLSLLINGKIELAGGLKISYVSQETAYLKGSLEEYAAGYGIDETLFKALLRKLDFSRTQFDKRIEDYSGGQKKKVLIARSLCEQAHLYLWDEPLNYIDVFSRMQIEELIRTYRPTLLMVEHDRSFVEAVGGRILPVLPVQPQRAGKHLP